MLCLHNDHHLLCATVFLGNLQHLFFSHDAAPMTSEKTLEHFAAVALWTHCTMACCSPACGGCKVCTGREAAVQDCTGSVRKQP